MHNWCGVSNSAYRFASNLLLPRLKKVLEAADEASAARGLRKFEPGTQTLQEKPPPDVAKPAGEPPKRRV
jgi:hypothetical protein